MIGEHTDYNGGLVFPAAIDKCVYFELSLNGLDKHRFQAIDLDEKIEVFVANKYERGAMSWANYLLGVLQAFSNRGHQVPGVDLRISSAIPIGAGLSSSAALCSGFAFGLQELLGLSLDRWTLAEMAQESEHNFAGVQCGIMDQFASLFGKKDRALVLDCSSREFRERPIELDQYQLILCDSQVKHDLADSAYNERREECAKGLEQFQVSHPNTKSISDIDWDDLILEVAFMDDLYFRRLSYVVQENERVTATEAALEAGNLQKVGKLLYQSHEGLEQLYQVSCPELDFLVDQTYQLPQVLGARMMGGGFGGCTLNLVKRSFIPEFRDRLSYAYRERFGKDCRFIEVEIGDGVRMIEKAGLPADTFLDV